ncbi:gas vesicle structural protein GvpA [Streptomyces albus subsp. chlorinus]|uniref:gas vesicle protein GvpJ n=1 Tax=Streptomyces albus TaxID=1888 RepID=UPI00157134D8|nr:gas vesicle protein GvpJ [Streptomyces albus]NSC23834.1 gas vesicle structural protein GvpA [Streptomyces albus subsp. chlorinus]
MTTTTYTEAVACVPRAGTLYDVLELILDRGMVIDIFVRVSLVGIEILKIDARIVVASVDTYLRFAEVCNRLDLNQDAASRTVPELFSSMAGGVRKTGAKRAVQSVGGKVKDAIGVGDEDEDDARDAEEEPAEEPVEAEERPRARRSTTGTRSASGTRTRTRATNGTRTRARRTEED